MIDVFPFIIRDDDDDDVKGVQNVSLSLSLFCFDKSTDDVDDNDDDDEYYYYYCRGGGALSTRGWCSARVRFSFKSFSKRVKDTVKP